MAPFSQFFWQSVLYNLCKNGVSCVIERLLGYSSVLMSYFNSVLFSCLSVKIYVVGTQKNRLIETIHLNTHKIHFN